MIIYLVLGLLGAILIYVGIQQIHYAEHEFLKSHGGQLIIVGSVLVYMMKFF